MKHDQIEADRVEKTKILNGDPVDYVSLADLAKKVGASTTNRYKGYGKASIPELVENIDRVLQTASMIDACRTSAENYKIAVTASKTSIVSAIAAWAAVVVGVLIAIFK